MLYACVLLLSNFVFSGTAVISCVYIYYYEMVKLAFKGSAYDLNDYIKVLHSVLIIFISICVPTGN